MDYETTQLNGHARRPIRGAMSGIGEVVGSSLELTSLQLRLLKVDAQQAALQIRPMLIAATLALGLIVSSLPVLGLGMSSLISAMTSLTLWQSQLLVGGTFLLIAGILFTYCWSALRRLGTAFDRSQQEATQNLQWLRHAIEQISR